MVEFKADVSCLFYFLFLFKYSFIPCILETSYPLTFTFISMGDARILRFNSRY